MNWVWGRWNILDEDRAAQRRGEPYWTLMAGDEDLCEGPIGRKAMHPERIVWTNGFECDGIDASDEHKRLIAAAPALYEALWELLPFIEEQDMVGETEWERAVIKARNVLLKIETP